LRVNQVEQHIARWPKKLFSLQFSRVVAVRQDALTKGLTNVIAVAYARISCHRAALLESCALVAAMSLVGVFADGAASSEIPSGVVPQTRSMRGRSATATIHWGDVPLSDAISRLEKLFGDSIFLDRRIDRNLRVNLDIRASSTEDVLKPIAAAENLGVSRFGRLVYVGPRETARQIKTVARIRLAAVSKLPEEQRTELRRKRRLSWPRLTEPRSLVTSTAALDGWRVEDPNRIPHDLWPAGALPSLTLVEQLTVMLAGFDLTFNVRTDAKVLELVPLETADSTVSDDAVDEESEPATDTAPAAVDTRQVYSLRVVEKPVGPVLQELGRRLNLRIEFDEPAIRAAGLSLDKRVSFAVENVGQDKLLRALLEPAGLAFEREGDVITVVPANASERP
jgi:hypothetical protein